MTLIEVCVVIIAGVHVCSGVALIVERIKSILHKKWIENQVESLKAAANFGGVIGGLIGVAVDGILKHSGAEKSAYTDIGNDANGKDNLGSGARTPV